MLSCGTLKSINVTETGLDDKSPLGCTVAKLQINRVVTESQAPRWAGSPLAALRGGQCGGDRSKEQASHVSFSTEEDRELPAMGEALRGMAGEAGLLI